MPRSREGRVRHISPLLHKFLRCYGYDEPFPDELERFRKDPQGFLDYLAEEFSDPEDFMDILRSFQEAAQMYGNARIFAKWASKKIAETDPKAKLDDKVQFVVVELLGYQEDVLVNLLEDTPETLTKLKAAAVPASANRSAGRYSPLIVPHLIIIGAYLQRDLQQNRRKFNKAVDDWLGSKIGKSCPKHSREFNEAVASLKIDFDNPAQTTMFDESQTQQRTASHD